MPTLPLQHGLGKITVTLPSRTGKQRSAACVFSRMSWCIARARDGLFSDLPHAPQRVTPPLLGECYPSFPGKRRIATERAQSIARGQTAWTRHRSEKGGPGCPSPNRAITREPVRPTRASNSYSEVLPPNSWCDATTILPSPDEPCRRTSQSALSREVGCLPGRSAVFACSLCPFQSRRRTLASLLAAAAQPEPSNMPAPPYTSTDPGVLQSPAGAQFQHSYFDPGLSPLLLGREREPPCEGTPSVGAADHADAQRPFPPSGAPAARSRPWPGPPPRLTHSSDTSASHAALSASGAPPPSRDPTHHILI